MRAEEKLKKELYTLEGQSVKDVFIADFVLDCPLYSIVFEGGCSVQLWRTAKLYSRQERVSVPLHESSLNQIRELLCGRQIIQISLNPRTMEVRFSFDGLISLSYESDLEESQELKEFIHFKYRQRNEGYIYCITAEPILFSLRGFIGCEKDLKRLREDLKEILNQNVIHSLTGGGAGSILFMQFENKHYLRFWCYWEIFYRGEIIATADSDATPMTGVMAMAAKALEGLLVESYDIDEDTLALHLIFNNDYEIVVSTEYAEEATDDTLSNWEYILLQKKLCYNITGHVRLEIKDNV